MPDSLMHISHQQGIEIADEICFSGSRSESQIPRTDPIRSPSAGPTPSLEHLKTSSMSFGHGRLLTLSTSGPSDLMIMIPIISISFLEAPQPFSPASTLLVTSSIT